jgi:tRNA G37 N-methylase Trm5
VVLDPFCGIGSTAIACMRLGGSFIGFDINQGYLDEAISIVMKEEELKELTSDMSSSTSESGCLRTINSNNNFNNTLSQGISQQRNKKLTDYISC